MSLQTESTVPRQVESGLTAGEAFRRLPKGSDYRVHDTPLDQLPGSRANKDKRTLAAFPRRDLTKHIGTEFRDASLQLSKLTDQQVQDLALLVAERGVVFFRQQDLTQDQQLALVRKLGPLHIHPVGWSDGENPEVQTLNFGPHSTGVVGEGWHSDVSFETEPASYSMLKITETPSSGGDTLFISSTAAYDALSPAYKKIIDGLEAIHSNKHVHYHSIDGAGTERGLSDFYRRGPHSSVHPVVRTHPLTGWRSIFVNPGFTTQIKGFTAEESKSILKFLYEHLQSDQFKVRFRWENGSVALWDNRCSQHEAIWDYFPEVRKGVRVVASGERPYYDPKSKSRIEDLQGKGAVLSPAWVRSIL